MGGEKKNRKLNVKKLSTAYFHAASSHHYQAAIRYQAFVNWLMTYAQVRQWALFTATNW